MRFIGKNVRLEYEMTIRNEIMGLKFLHNVGECKIRISDDRLSVVITTYF